MIRTRIQNIDGAFPGRGAAPAMTRPLHLLRDERAKFERLNDPDALPALMTRNSPQQMDGKVKRRTGPGRLSLEIADQMAPRDPKYQGRHYRAGLAEAHTVIEAYRHRITELEDSLERMKRDCDYRLSLCVTRTVAEEARLRAFRLALNKAANLAEGKGGEPTNLSVAIESIPEPKPKWTK